jgi:hypothetical protein
MKKVFTLLAAIVLSVGSFAQQIPNGGFENWTINPNAPDYWGTYGNITGAGVMGFTFPYFAIKDTSTGNHPQGLSSLKLITDTLPAFANGTLLPSVACIGSMSLDANNRFHYIGIPYTKRIDSIYWDYKYTPAVATDTAVIIFTLSKMGSSILQRGGSFIFPLTNTSGSWLMKYSLLDAHSATNYANTTDIPDTLSFIIMSSGGYARIGTNTMGSTLWIDGIRFDAAVNVTTGLEELNGKVLGVNVYPNPASAQLNIAVESDEVGSLIQLFDIAGREVYSGSIDKSISAIDTRNFESGIYSMRVISTDKMTTYKGKVTITH